MIDNNDPQQLNGYAYANNSPVTYSDPTGLIKDCGPDGVLCNGPDRGIHGPNWEDEKTTFGARDRALQQANAGNNEAVRSRLAEEGIPWEDYQRALAEAHKTKWDVIKEVAWEVIKDISGWNDIVDCFTKGDIWACAGLVPWGKAAKILEAGYKAVSRLAGIVDKAKGVLRRVQAITDDVTRIAAEKFQKLLARGSEGCVAKHSCVATTLVLMADGSTKPISEVEIGDKVKATDPTTGHTTDRDVVATIVHNDEDDMTRLTVAGEDGTTGSVDATSWHPVWVDAENRFVNIGDLKPGQLLTSTGGLTPPVEDVQRYTRVEPVYDLTVDSVHTYYVVASAVPVLVHNCEREKKVVDLTLEPGPYAVEGVSVARGDRIDSVTEQPIINELGDAHGCHTSPAKSPGNKNGNWVGDHVPANKSAPGGPFTAYPQCKQCARTQGGVVNGINREWYDFSVEQ